MMEYHFSAQNLILANLNDRELEVYSLSSQGFLLYPTDEKVSRLTDLISQGLGSLLNRAPSQLIMLALQYYQ